MSKPIRIRKTVYGGLVPRVAAIIDGPIELVKVKKLAAQGVDLLELRVDLFSQSIEKALTYVGALRKVVTLPLLATVRETKSNKADREAIFTELIPLVDMVDIEIDSAIRGNVIALAKKRKKKVIVSEHDFKKTPSDNRLSAIALEAKWAGADMVKIAAMAKGPADVVRLLAFCRSCPFPTVAISMGSHGAISRVLAPLFGSLFTYACLGKPVAPGQLRLDDLVAELKRYYPA